MEKIEGVPQSVVDLLSLCWEEYPDACPTFGEIVDYVQAEVRNEVMGEGGGTEGKGSRRTSTSGGLVMRITVAKAKKEQEELDEEVAAEEVAENEASELDVWKSRCAELERELKELREIDRGEEGKTKKKRGKTEVHTEGNLKEVGKDI